MVHVFNSLVYHFELTHEARTHRVRAASISLPSDLTALVKSMLEMDPFDRPSLPSCLQSVSRIVQTLN